MSFWGGMFKILSSKMKKSKIVEHGELNVELNKKFPNSFPKGFTTSCSSDGGEV